MSALSMDVTDTVLNDLLKKAMKVYDAIPEKPLASLIFTWYVFETSFGRYF